MTGPRILVVEDEPLLRRQLCASLRELWPEISELAEAASGAEAVRLIGAQMPDIAFLDINLPDMSGMDLAPLLRDKVQMVFVTAYSEFAVEAFAQHALDYVMKPATSKRLADTVTRLRAAYARGEEPAQLSAEALAMLSGRGRQSKNQLRWISASTGNTTQLIPVADVLCFNADDKYTEVITQEGEWLIRKPIRELLNELSEDEFWQVHRATLVRVAAIERVVRGENGTMELHLRNLRRTFPVSRNYAHRFRQL